MPQPKPELRPGSVRTLLVVRSCPMCGVPLSGRQTVCSAKCRIARSRQKHEKARANWDAKVRLHLKEALELLGQPE
jgi:predicted nucleic acid-binding Zn ribbon protein